MPFDTFFMACVTGELAEKLTGARLDKASCPDKHEILLSFRTGAGQVALLLSARPGAARLHLTETKRENPETPPVFCMLLRKHLAGARLISLTQAPAERLCDLLFSCYDELGDPTERHIFFECAGKIPNIVFTDGDLRIIDCTRRINLDESSAGRPMLPGLKYRPPERPAGLIDPFSADLRELSSRLSASVLTARDALFESVAGMSPFLATRALAGAEIDGDVPVPELSGAAVSGLAGELSGLARLARSGGTPVLLLGPGGTPRDYYFTEPHGAAPGSFELFPGYSPMLDRFYAGRDGDAARKARRAELLRPVKNALAREMRKTHARQTELAETLGRERLREFGDILSANLHLVPKGAEKISLPDFYGPEGSGAEIPLLPELSPQQNAQRYYREYSRKKSAERHLRELILSGEGEIKYLEGLLFHIENADGEGLAVLREELADSGLLKVSRRKKQRRLPAVPPHTYDLGDGFTLVCGRSELQNDELTFKSAAFNDIWLHARNIPGSHCILKCGGKEAPAGILQKAADLAALHSSVGGAAAVPVDYSPVKNIKKLRGGRPGAVIYEKYQTIFSNPSKDGKRP